MPKTDTRETMVNVKEATAPEAASSEFVRQGLVAIQAINRGLSRMQGELAYLVNSQAAQRGIIVVGGAPQGNPYASFPQSQQGFANPWATGAFTPVTIPGTQNAFSPVTLPGAPTSYTPLPLPGSSPWSSSGFPGMAGINPSTQFAAPSFGPSAGGFVSQGTAMGFNPQSEPPGRNVSLNPQPLPPQGTGITIPAGFPMAGAQYSQASIAANLLGNPQGNFQGNFASFGNPSNLLGGPDTSPYGRQEGLSPLLRSGHDLQNSAPVGRIPACDVIDEGSEFLIRVEVPGCSPEKLDLTCYPSGIVVTANSDSDIPEGTLLLAESGRVSFRRAIELPAEIKTHECKASLQDGILTVHVAKVAPTEGPRHVDVAYR